MQFKMGYLFQCLPQEEAYLPGVGDGDIVEDFKKFKKEKKVLFAKEVLKVK